MEPCVHLNDYGFSKGSPCIFLKFKKTLDWTPEYLDYDDLAVAGLSRGFVADIREKIAKDDPKKLVRWKFLRKDKLFRKDFILESDLGFLRRQNVDRQRDYRID